MLRFMLLVSLCAGCSSNGTPTPDVSDPLPPPVTRTLRIRTLVLDESGAVTAVVYGPEEVRQ